MDIFLITDLLNSVHRAVHVAQKADTPEERAAFAMHLVLQGIAAAWRKHKCTHLVVALDGRSWRKDFYAPYKANRDAKKQTATPDAIATDKCVKDACNDLIEFVISRTNATVLYSPILEADDQVQGWIVKHPNDHHIVNSSDSDFFQLISSNVTQFNGVTGETHTINGIFDINGNQVVDKKTGLDKPPPNPEWLLFEKCVRGDSGDNVFSAYPGVRLKGTKKTVGVIAAFEDRHRQGFEWNTFMQQTWTDHEGIEHKVKDDYQRNRTLIDLTAQPEHVRMVITECIDASCIAKQNKQVGSHFLKFCGKFNLNRISEQPDIFAKIFSSPYPQEGI